MEHQIGVDCNDLGMVENHKGDGDDLSDGKDV